MRRAIRELPGAAVEHPQHIRDLRDRADRGADARAAATLLQRNGRRQSLDIVDIRGPGLIEQSPRIGRDGFQVAPLRLGIEGTEGERRFPRTGHTGEDDKGVSWNLQVDVSQIVFARPPDGDPPGERTARYFSVTH
jgi:hypothetical protein